MVFQVKRALRDVPGAQVGAYGHVADGDLHFNPITPEYDPFVRLLPTPDLSQIII